MGSGSSIPVLLNVLEDVGSSTMLPLQNEEHASQAGSPHQGQLSTGEWPVTQYNIQDVEIMSLLYIVFHLLHIASTLYIVT